MNLREIKDELERMEDASEIISEFEKSSFLHNKEFLMEVNDDTPFKIKLINSAIKEKNEINERLSGLSYNLGLLRATILTKDIKSSRKHIQDFINNEYYGANVIIQELNDFKSKIEKAECNYKKLAENAPKTIDFHINSDGEHIDHVKKLYTLQNKQKEIFTNMGKIFVKLTRGAINSKSLRNRNKKPGAS